MQTGKRRKRLRYSLHRNRYELGAVTQATRPVEKLSTVLLDLIDPYRSDEDGPDDLKGLVQIGVVAWNLALMPLPQVVSELSSFLDAASGRTPEPGSLAKSLDRHESPEALAVLTDVLCEMVARKLSYYGDDRRCILDYALVDEGDCQRLLVNSAMFAE